MKTLLTTLALVSLNALTAAAATEDNIHENLAVAPGGKLVVDVDFGSIDVANGDNDKVVIDAHRKVEFSTKAKEEEYFRAVPVTVTTEGNTVSVRAVRKDHSLGRHFWDFLGRSRMDARYTIRVPAHFNVDLDTAGGAISTTGLTGSVKADTSGGDLTFQKIHGDIHADTSGGDIKVTTSEGSAHLETSGGNIEITESRGRLDAETSGGKVTVLNFAGSAKVESSGGKLRLANISGKLDAETSGGAIAAILPATVTDDVNLETSAGAITVMTPPNANLTIDAETSAGSVRSDLPLANVRSDDDSLKGTINGGGKKLTLRSGAGSIEIISADRRTAQQ
jgi:hypothetical protein